MIRLSTMSHVSCKGRRLMSSRSRSAAIRRKAIERSGAPKSIGLIRDQGDPVGHASVMIRPIGGTRRIFILNPFFSSDEMEGLAYRIRTLTKNESINSVLIATSDVDDVETGALPNSLLDLDNPYFGELYTDEGFPPEPGKTWHVCSGYDPVALYKSGQHRQVTTIDRLLTNLGNVALALRGDHRATKIPVICVPHGALCDGGFVFCMSNYVMATRETSFRITNPSKGLSLDPVGLSYVLPRLGQEFRQPASKYIGCGMILALMGYEANAADMMETGLATNYMDSILSLGKLENTLSEIPAWNKQTILKNPVRFEGEPEPVRDHNAQFRNVAVANTVHCFSSYRADGGEMWVCDENLRSLIFDPSLETDSVPWYERRRSDVVDYAASFHEIFISESTIAGILERFKEVASRDALNPEDKDLITIARDFVRRLEEQSPLAVSVVHRLLKLGAGNHETMESCMHREKKAQLSLFGRRDFENWAVSAARSADDELMKPFNRWKHSRIADVSEDEVLEVISGN